MFDVVVVDIQTYFFTTAGKKVTFVSVTFQKKFWNHLNKETEVCYKDSTTSSKYFPETYDILWSAKFAISTSSNVKNKSTKKILDNIGPKIDPCGT